MLMYLLFFLGICHALTPPLDESSRQPSNALLSATPLGNLFLGAPPDPPWALNIGQGLSMVVTWYSEYVPQAEWDAFRRDYDDLIRRIEFFSQMQPFPWRRKQKRLFRSEFVTMECIGVGTTDSSFAIWAVKFLQGVKRLRFVYRDFSAEIRRGNEIVMYVTITYEPEPSTWPQQLPWTLPVSVEEWSSAAPSDLNLVVYLYGPYALEGWRQQIFDDLSSLVELLEFQGSPTDYLSEYEFKFPILRVRLDAPQTGGGTVPSTLELTRLQMWGIVRTVLEQYDTRFEFQLREFGANITFLQEVKAKIFISFDGEF